MGAKKASIAAVFAGLLFCQTALACDVPDGAAKLLKSLDDADRGVRDMGLPKAKSDEMSRNMRRQLISNHILLRDLDCSVVKGPGANRPPSEEELSVQRRIIRQNEQILDELRQRR